MCNTPKFFCSIGKSAILFYYVISPATFFILIAKFCNSIIHSGSFFCLKFSVEVENQE